MDTDALNYLLYVIHGFDHWLTLIKDYLSILLINQKPDCTE